MEWRVVYYDKNPDVHNEIVVKADTKCDAYVTALMKLGPDYYPKSSKGGIIDVIKVGNQ